VVTPDLFCAEFMKVLMAPPMPLVPAVGGNIIPPPIPPPICTGAVPFLPSRTPSAASFIIAVTRPDEELKPSVCAYFDIAASVMP
jgi:hypothetical protein